MAKDKVVMSFKIKSELHKIPNLWHYKQVLKGGKIHKDKKKLIPRKQKYKKEKDYE